MHFSLVEIWPAMSPLAKAVMILLVGMSLSSLAVAIEKWLRLRRVAAESARFLAEWRSALERDGFATAAAGAADYPSSFAAHTLASATAVLASDADPSAKREAFDRTVQHGVRAANAALRQGLGVLATVGSTGPFVGLFGTVVGIVAAFQQMGLSGQGGLAVVATGIAEALITTALGIGVAIPALWLYNYLTQRIQSALAEIEGAADELAIAALIPHRRRRRDA